MLEGEKYLEERIEKMRHSGARVSAGMAMRVWLLLGILAVGWVGCDQGFKFFQNHPEFDSDRTAKSGEFSRGR